MFLFNPEIDGGSKGHDNVTIGTWGFIHDWIVKVALHEIGHVFGLGESLSEIFTKQYINAEWHSGSDWIYTTVFDYPLLAAAGHEALFRAAFTSEHAYRTLWERHFNSFVTYQRLAWSRAILFNLLHTQGDIVAFTGVDPYWFGDMVFGRAFELFKNYVDNGDYSGREEFNKFIEMLYDFGKNHPVGRIHSVFDSEVHGFYLM